MRDYMTLRELVRNCGANLVEEHVDPQTNGRAEAVFQGQSQTRFRFTWDGKQHCGSLQPDGAGAAAQALATVIRKPVGSHFSNLRQFLVAAQSFALGLH